VAATEPPILEFRNLRMSYHSRHGVLRAITDASLKVEKAEAVGLVGESGSGKSSLARAALGLLPDGVARIEGGDILIGGRNSTHFAQPDWERERGSPLPSCFKTPWRI